MNFLDKRVKNQNAYLTAKHYQSLEIPKNRNKYFENVLLLISPLQYTQIVRVKIVEHGEDLELKAGAFVQSQATFSLLWKQDTIINRNGWISVGKLELIFTTPKTSNRTVCFLLTIQTICQKC